MATQVFKIPESFRKNVRYSFCPGCDHGVAVRLVAECLDELGLTENAITATSIGCSVGLYDFLNVDSIEAPHGRALAVATGVKELNLINLCLLIRVTVILHPLAGLRVCTVHSGVKICQLFV